MVFAGLFVISILLLVVNWLTSSQSLVHYSEIPRNLVAFIAIGRPETLPSVLHNVEQFVNWKCIVFVWADEAKLSSNHSDMVKLSQRCSIERWPGLQWGQFLAKLDVQRVQAYEHIAVVLDDIYLPKVGPRPINVPALLEDLHRYNLSSVSPAFHGGSMNSMRPESKMCLVQGETLEIYLGIYSAPSWKCLQGLLVDHNPGGWCYDIVFARSCGIVAINKSQEGYHLERARVPVQLQSPGFVHPQNVPHSGSGDMHLCGVSPENPWPPRQIRVELACLPDSPQLKNNLPN